MFKLIIDNFVNGTQFVQSYCVLENALTELENRLEKEMGEIICYVFHGEHLITMRSK